MMQVWPGQFFELWAEFKPFKGAGTTHKVAVFLSQKSAGEYLDASKLKNPTKSQVFRKASLLYGAYHAWIEEAEEYPIEPTL
jgi:hypothetical protein